MPQQRLDVHQFGQTYYRTEPKSALSIRFITASTVIEPSVIVAPSRDVTERGSATPAGRGAGRAAVPGARPRVGRGLAAGHCERLAARPVVRADPDAWAAYLRRNLVDSRRAVALTTEGALIGSLAAPGFNLEIGLVSDDAGQFGLFVHGLFWVHAERPLSHLVPLNASDRRAIAWVRRQVWFLYRDLKAYRQHPDPEAKDRITAGFEALCATETTCEPLNQVLQGFQRNQAELLQVLESPDWPIHNNRSEPDLRDRVKKRQISAGTRSEVGRQCRDTFASLKKTCRKQGVSFWAYLKDRVAGRNVIPSLAELIRRPATA